MSVELQSQQVDYNSPLNCSEHVSDHHELSGQMSAKEFGLLTRPNSAIKLRSDATHKIGCSDSKGTVQNSEGQSDIYTALKPKKLSNFGLTSGKKQELLPHSENRFELMKEYELALDRIQSALADKNFQLTQLIREKDIKLEQKDKYIEELTEDYEQQIEQLEKAYVKSTHEVKQLQQETKQQGFLIQQFKLQIESQNQAITQMKSKHGNKENEAATQIQILKSMNKEFQHLLEAERAANQTYKAKNELLEQNQKELERLRSLSDDLTKTLMATEEQNAVFRAQLAQQQVEMQTLRYSHEEKQNYVHLNNKSQRILGDSNIVSNLMISELNQTKEAARSLESECIDLKKKLSQLQQNYASLKFQTETVKKYNGVLLRKLEEGKSGRTNTSWTGYRTASIVSRAD